MALVVETIVAVRNARATAGVPAGDWLETHLAIPGEERASFEALASAIGRLARARPLALHASRDELPGGAGSLELILPAGDIEGRVVLAEATAGATATGPAWRRSSPRPRAISRRPALGWRTRPSSTRRRPRSSTGRGRARPSWRARSSGCASGSPSRPPDPPGAAGPPRRASGPTGRRPRSRRDSPRPRRRGRGRGRSRPRRTSAAARRRAPTPAAANASVSPTVSGASSICLDRRVQVAGHDDRIRQPGRKVGQRRDLATPLLAPDVREMGRHDAHRPDPAADRAASLAMSRLDVGVADAGQWMVDTGRLDTVVVGRPGQPARRSRPRRRAASAAHCPTSRTRPSRRSRDRRAGTRGRRHSGPEPGPSGQQRAARRRPRRRRSGSRPPGA